MQNGFPYSLHRVRVSCSQHMLIGALTAGTGILQAPDGRQLQRPRLRPYRDYGHFASRAPKNPTSRRFGPEVVHCRGRAALFRHTQGQRFEMLRIRNGADAMTVYFGRCTRALTHQASFDAKPGTSVDAARQVVAGQKKAGPAVKTSRVRPASVHMPARACAYRDF